VGVGATRVDQRTAMVISKEPRPGQVKTRMCPPLSLEQASQLASAALTDTFSAVNSAQVDRRVAVFEGNPAGVVPQDWEVVAQRTGGLDVRLADAFDDVLGTDCYGQSAVLLAMDTPQVTSQQIEAAFDLLVTHDSVIGMTEDGGYWIVGLNVARRKVFEGVPMSQPTTGAAQLQRMYTLGLTVAVTDTMRDLDTVEDVQQVALDFPDLLLSRWWGGVQ
jgi:uncharacterized protein